MHRKRPTTKRLFADPGHAEIGWSWRGVYYGRLIDVYNENALEMVYALSPSDIVANVAEI